MGPSWICNITGCCGWLSGDAHTSIASGQARSGEQPMQRAVWLIVSLGLLGLPGSIMPCNAAEIVGIDGQCLDVQGGGTADDTPVLLYHCHNTANQQWFYRNGQIVGSSGKCLDVQRGDTVDGTRIVLFHCHDGPNQQWSFYNGHIVGFGGKCLDAQGGSAADGTPIILFRCHGARNQQWSMP
jgi:hypothetical protein